MSVHVMSWVLRHSEATLGARLVLLVLADHAKEDGTGAWPAVATIAREARMSKRGVRYALRRLEEEGLITATGVSRAETTVWRITLAESAGGEAESAPKGAEIAPEPSLEPSLGELRSPLVVFGDEKRGEDILFAYWQTKCSRPRSKFTEHRRRALRARRREGYDWQTIRLAIDGAAARPYVVDGRKYDDLELICRNGSKLEDFAARSGTGGGLVAEMAERLFPGADPVVARKCVRQAFGRGLMDDDGVRVHAEAWFPQLVKARAS